MNDRLFKHHLNHTFNCSLMIMHGNNIGIKLRVINERSSVLWHNKLGHIFIDRIKILVNDGALDALNFTHFSTYGDYIKEKQINKSKKVTGSLLMF